MGGSTGRVWKFGDNVDTDAILPAQYLNRTDPRELAEHCFEVTDPDFCREAKEGDYIVAGSNFGCGSSREHAPVAIKAKGIRCVIAKSFARIFFRNAFNVGLPLVESPEAAETIEQGHRIAEDLKKGEIRDLSTGRVYRFESIPEHMMRILEHGGLIPFLAQKRRSR